jgi:hypothetical protein
MWRSVVHATAITARASSVPGTGAHASAGHGTFGASLGVDAATAAVATAAAGTGRAAIGADAGAWGGGLILDRCWSGAGIGASAGSFGAFTGGKGAEAQEADGCGNQVGGTHDVLLEKQVLAVNQNFCGVRPRAATMERVVGCYPSVVVGSFLESADA